MYPLFCVLLSCIHFLGVESSDESSDKSSSIFERRDRHCEDEGGDNCWAHSPDLTATYLELLWAGSRGLCPLRAWDAGGDWGWKGGRRPKLHNCRPGRQCGTQIYELAMWVFSSQGKADHPGIPCSLRSPHHEWMAKWTNVSIEDMHDEQLWMSTFKALALLQLIS